MSTTGQVKTTPTSRYDTFVEQQLTRARNRIRALDMGAAALGFVVLTFVYGLAMALADKWLELPSLARQAAFGLYALVALGYLGVTVVWPLCRRVNPYYAARQVEQALPGAKNSVVNWLDLHDRPLPSAIRGALTHRAAKDLARADIDHAISARRAGWLGGCALGLFVAMVVFFLLGPPQFLSLLRRAFAPFTEAAIATRTTITLVEPAEGNVTVPIDREVAFKVRVDGRVPTAGGEEALKLRFRYNPGEPYIEQDLVRGDGTREWGTSVAAPDVHNGFWYKVTGGDAETPEYRVQVRATPLLTDYEVTYHHRAYTRLPNRTTTEPNIDGLRGTEVTLVARANRPVKEARLRMGDTKDWLPAELVPGNPQAMRFHFVLDRETNYRVFFISTEGDGNTEPPRHDVKVQPDRAPDVSVTSPGKDTVELPANGLLQVEGDAKDDYGLTALTLKTMVGNTTQAWPYRKDKSFGLENGGNPRELEYKDFVELEKVRTNGKPLEPGMTVEYWLEATDNCDFPGPNVGMTPHYRVKIAPPADKKAQQQQKQKAEESKKQHEQQQDEKLKKEGEQSKPDASQEQQPSKQDNGEKDQSDQGAGDERERANAQDQADPKGGNEKQQDSQGPAKPDAGSSGQPKDQQAKPDGGQPQGQSDQDKQLEDTKRKLENAAKQQESKSGQPGKEQDQSKGDKPQSPKPQEGTGDNKQPGGPNANPNPKNGERDPRAQEKPNDHKAQAGGSQDKPGDANSKPGNDPNARKPEGKDDAGKPGTGNRPDGKQPKAAPDQPGDPKGPEKAKPDQQPGDGNKPNTKEPNPAAPKDGQKPSPADGARGKQADAHKGKGEQPGAQKNPSENAGQKDTTTKPEGKNGPDGASKQPQPGSPSPEKNPGKDQSPPKQSASPNAGKGEKEQGSSDKPGDQNKRDPADGPKKGPGTNTQNTAPSNDEGGSKPNEGGKDKAGQPNASKGGQPGKPDGQKGDANGAERKDQGEGNGDQRKPSDRNTADPANPVKRGTEKDANQSGDKGKEPKGTNDRNAEKKQPNPGKDSPGNGDPKDGGQQSNGKGHADRGSKQDQGGSKDKPTKEQIEKLIEDLKNGKADARRKAGEKLKDQLSEIEDPDLRKQAEDALKKGGIGKEPEPGNGERTGSKPHVENPEKQGADDNGKPSDPKADGNGRTKKPGGSKGSEGQGIEGAGTGNEGTGKSPNKHGDGKEGGNVGGAGKGQGGENGEGKNGKRGPGGGGAAPGNRQGDAANGAGDAPTKASGDPKALHRAGELQLEDLKKRVTKDVLKDPNVRMTEADYRDWLKAYEAMLKRKQAAAERDKLTDPKARAKGLSNIGARKVNAGKGKADTLQQGTQGYAPPEFREAYKEFTQKLSTVDQGRGQK